MQDELEKQLVEQYPDIFEYYDKEFEGPAPNISLFGFECGDGWYEIIESLCEYITQQDISLQVVQVKEKFGGLRFYYDNVEVEDKRRAYMLQGAVNMAASMSQKTCEFCGEPGELRNDGGWYKTRCEDCIDKQISK